jgi:hypothetical protein
VIDQFCRHAGRSGGCGGEDCPAKQLKAAERESKRAGEFSSSHPREMRLRCGRLQQRLNAGGRQDDEQHGVQRDGDHPEPASASSMAVEPARVWTAPMIIVTSTTGTLDRAIEHAVDRRRPHAVRSRSKITATTRRRPGR